MRSRISGYVAMSVAAMLSVQSGNAFAQSAPQPIVPLTAGLAGGAAIPMGDLSSGVTTGWTALGLAGFAVGQLPVTFRITGSYSSFKVKKDLIVGANTGGDSWTGEGSLNAVYSIAAGNTSGVIPYLTAGAGFFHSNVALTAEVDEASASASGSENNFGFNVGGGISFRMGGAKIFAEARYLHFSTDGIVPIVVGIGF